MAEELLDPSDTIDLADELFRLVTGVAAALAGFLVQGLVDFTLWDMRYALPLAAMVSLPLVCRVKPKAETETR